MLFSVKLKTLRREKGLTQLEAAKLLGISLRTMQNYESGKSYPKQTSVYAAMASLFGVTADYLLSEEDRFIMDASERGGTEARKDVQALIAEVGGLFAGGELSDADKEKVLRAINDLYWKARDNERRYGSRQISDEMAEDSQSV